MSSINSDQIVGFINRWYDQIGINEEDNKIRKCLWKAITRPYFLFKGNIIEADGGNSSGNPGTALRNNLDNVIKFRYCFKKLCPGKNFDEEIRFVAGGDDHVWSASRNVKDTFNSSGIQKMMNDIGMTWTPADKTDDLKVKGVDDLLFLGRDVNGVLRDSSISKMLHFVRNADVVESTIVNIQTALRELSRRSKSEYDLFRNDLINSCVKAGIDVSAVWSYKQAKLADLHDEIYRYS
jgi:hypothetical protein